jgi:glycosyltransferase involved in cell wall biosynthesis
MPKVSVIMNCYNGEKYLREAIDSIYAQTFHDWEIVFFDNASTDKSAAIARSYDSRLKYIWNEELIVLGKARKEALLKATGDWIAFLDTDDKWYPHKLETQLNALSNTDYIACYAGVRQITPDGKKIRDSYPKHHTGNVLGGLLLQFDVNMVTPMFHRKIAIQYGISFDPVITASEEYNLFMRLAAKGIFLVQNDLLGEYRVSIGSLTDQQISKWGFERNYTLDKLELENPGVTNRYLVEFAEARARGNYYDAQYMVSEGKFTEAKGIMRAIKGQDYRYKVLYYLLHVPYLWNFMHSKVFRSKITSLIKADSL